MKYVKSKVQGGIAEMRVPVGRIFSLKQEIVLNEIMFCSKEAITRQNGITKHTRVVNIRKIAENLGVEKESVLRYIKIFNEKTKNIKEIEDQVKGRKLDVEIEINRLQVKRDYIISDLEYVEFLKDFSKLKFT